MNPAWTHWQQNMPQTEQSIYRPNLSHLMCWSTVRSRNISSVWLCGSCLYPTRGVTYAIFKFCLLFNDSGVIILDQVKEKKISLLCKGKKHWHSGNLIPTELDWLCFSISQWYVLYFYKIQHSVISVCQIPVYLQCISALIKIILFKNPGFIP